MDTIGDWSHEDHLSLNISRIKFMQISYSKQHSQCPQMLLDGTLLEQVFHFKYQECGCQLISPAPNTLFLLHARHADYWDTFLEPFSPHCLHQLLWPSTEPRFCLFSINDVFVWVSACRDRVACCSSVSVGV